MFTNKKITAVLAALTMMVSSFAAMTVASAAEVPTVTMDYVEKADLVVDTEADFGIKFTVTGLEKDAESISFFMEVPGEKLQTSVNTGTAKKPVWTLKNVVDATAAEAAIGAEESSIFYANSFDTPLLSTSDSETGLYKFKYDWAILEGTMMKNGATFEMDFYFAEGADKASLPVGSFALSGLEIVYYGEIRPVASTDIVNNAEVKGGTAEITPVITPAEGQSELEAAEAYTGYAAADKVIAGATGDDPTDIATGFKATVSGTSSTGDVIWKITSGSDTKYHKMSTGASFAGEGSAVIGLAVANLADGSASVAFMK